MKAFLRYATARLSERQKDMAYRFYVTDALRMVTENTAKYGKGSYIKTRFYDVMHPKPEEIRTSDEIIAHIREKLEVSDK